MIELNFKTTEELIFKDKEVRDLFPEYKKFFDSWMVSQRVPGLKNLGKRSVFDFLNSINQSNLEILSTLFKDKVVKYSIDYNIVKLISESESNLENSLQNIEGFSGIAITKKGEEVKVCLWK